MPRVSHALFEKSQAMQLPTHRIAQHPDLKDIAYERLHHKRDYTARQTACDCHLEPSCFAGVIGVEADGRRLLAVPPADHIVDLPRLQRLLGVNRIALLPVSALATCFRDCEVGAFPPLGKLYGLPVYVALAPAQQGKIAFNAGTHEQAIRMAYKDFDLMVRPTVMDFSTPAGHRETGAPRCRPS